MNITRAILEGIHEVELEITPEFQKPADQKLMDVIGDYVDQEVIAIHNLSEEPSDVNRVWFPGNAKKYSIINSKLFGDIQERIDGSGVHWGWNGPKHMFYMYPGAGMSVPVFWGHVRDLASWFIEQVGGRGEGSFDKPNVSSDDKGINKGVTWWDFGQALVLVGRIYPAQKKIDVLGHASSVDARMDELMKMFSWLRDHHRGYNIVVYGGNVDAEDMDDLQNAGMIDKFVPEAKEKE